MKLKIAIVALILAIAVAIGAVGMYISGAVKLKKLVAASEANAAAETTETTEEVADEAEAEATEAEGDTVEGLELTDTTITVVASGNEEEEAVEDFVLPTEMKEVFTGEAFNKEADNLTAFELEFPERTLNFNSYSDKVQERKATGMTDAVSTGLIIPKSMAEVTPAAQAYVAAHGWEGDTALIQAAFHMWLEEAVNNPAELVHIADFLANHIIFEDGDTLGNVLPVLRMFVAEDDQTISNTLRYRELVMTLSFMTAAMPGYSEGVVERDSLIGQRGLEHWAQTRNGLPERNLHYDQYACIVTNCLKEFDVLGVKVITSKVNYYSPNGGDDLTLKIIENTEYQVKNQPILALGKVNKNGKLTMVFGPDVRDNRMELKATDYSQRKATGKTTTTTTTTTTSTTTTGDSESTTKKKTEEEEDTGKINLQNTGTVTSPGKKEDGKGGKDAKNSAVANNNAPDTGHTNEHPENAGQPTEKPVTPTGEAATVIAGSAESGSRNNNTAGYNGTSTNGSSMSSDTSNGPANGTVDSTGATVDNQLTTTNDSVDTQAAKQGDEGTGKAGWTLSAEDGE